MAEPSLVLFQDDSSLSRPKIDRYRKLSTAELIESLQPAKPGSLKARPDRTVIDVHHRLMMSGSPQLVLRVCQTLLNKRDG